MTKIEILFMEMIDDWFKENERLEKKRYLFIRKWLARGHTNKEYGKQKKK